MATFSISHLYSRATGQYVRKPQFGANALHEVNLNEAGDFVPTEAFTAALDAVGVANLRYPGGHVENTIDVIRLVNGQIRSEVKTFLDWCVARSTPDNPMYVTFVLPTKVDYSQSAIRDFVIELLSNYGSLIKAFEIGNEYSIGQKETNADRSVHPEYIAGSDYIAAMNEVEYGIAANRTILGVQDAIDRLGTVDPDILIQMGEPAGAASSYKGSGNYDLANEAIVSMLSSQAKAAIDGTVAHYYYNKQHDDSSAFDHDWQEIRRLDERFANFDDHLGKQTDSVITEWNVLTSNYSQLGLIGASVVLEMFERMVQMGIDEADVWPLQHRTGNTPAGDGTTGDADLSMIGAAMQMLSESVAPQVSETGRETRFELRSSGWSGLPSTIEIDHYQSEYSAVFYLSLRDTTKARVNLDLSDFASGSNGYDVRKLGIDSASSDGLSDFANADGGDRISRRYIDEAELAELSKLAFFDADNANHVKMSGSNIRTYLPDYRTIIPLVSNPQSISDYYFAGEADVTPLITSLDNAVDSSSMLSVDLLPYEVVEIRLNYSVSRDGSGDSEVLRGGIGRDLIGGLGGNDTLRGGEGDDVLNGGTGNDLVYGGVGDDSIVATSGVDTVNGNYGNDTIQLGADDAVVNGGTGVDEIQTQFLRDDMEVSRDGQTLLLTSATTEYRLDGVEWINFAGQRVAASELKTPPLIETETNPTAPRPSAPMVIEGSSFSDTIETGTGNDTVRPGLGGDQVSLFAGDDIVEENSSLYAFMTTGSDTIFGGAGNDQFDMVDGNDWVYGDDGADLINAGRGHDHLFGGRGADTLRGGDGNDLLNGGQGADTHFGDAGADTLSGFDGNDLLDGGDGHDLLFGADDADTVLGHDGADTLRGGQGDDVLAGGTGADLTFMGSGNDRYFDGPEVGLDGRDTVYAGGGNDIVHGGGGDDAFYGNAGGDRLLAGLGDDLLFGGNQDDTLFGGAGNDTLVGGNGRDRAFLGDGDDVWQDNAQSQFGDDFVEAGRGADRILLGGGNDTVTGGAGADTFVFLAAIDADVISDFEVGVDRLQIDAGLWGPAALDQARWNNIAQISDAGVVLDFGGGDMVTLEGLSSLSGFLDAISLI